MEVFFIFRGSITSCSCPKGYLYTSKCKESGNVFKSD